MSPEAIAIVVLVVASIPWAIATFRAHREGLDVMTLALFLVLLSAIGSGLLGRLGFTAYAGVPFGIAGLLLLIFWPRSK